LGSPPGGRVTGSVRSGGSEAVPFVNSRRRLSMATKKKAAKKTAKKKGGKKKK
jgi:hypothetical protein